MAKKQTKQQREASELAALERRLVDIYSGASGGVWAEDDFATAKTLEDALPVIKAMFLTEEKHYLLELWNLGKFDNPKSAAAFLYENGVRA